jgi:viroplasmin and RNaseH domain-containing protein
VCPVLRTKQLLDVLTKSYRGVTQALVSSYSNNEYKGFITLNEAISFMEEREHPSYQFFCGSAEGERAPVKGELAYYTTANGEHVRVYKCYQ